MKKFITTNVMIASTILMIPFVAFAAPFTNITPIIAGIATLITTLIPVAYGIALLFFFWGVAKFILAAGNAEAQAEGKKFMLWGVIALFTITSIWGLIKFLQVSLGISAVTNARSPYINP